jgi:hypothetical protein
MTVHFSASPTSAFCRVRRPLSGPELDTVRRYIHADVPNAGELLDSVVAAVFALLLADVDETYPDQQPNPGFERGQYAIPVTQWMAISLAVTARARTWGATTAVEMDLAALMPGAYDAPDVPTPDLGPTDQRPSSVQLEITRPAGEVIAACQRHLDELAYAYGGLDLSYLIAANSWNQQLGRLLTAPAGTQAVLHADGPLSLYVSTGDGDHHSIAFQPDPNRCTTGGCEAVATVTPGGVLLWQPASPEPAGTDHDHTPHQPPGAPQRGTWITRR